jgi:enoyl-CoA hydratase
MENQTNLLITRLESNLLHISLNRPSVLNALNHELLLALHHVFINAKQDRLVKALLITGEGKNFCAGADIKQLAVLGGPEGLEFARCGQAVFRLLETLGKPTLAAIDGFALGGGCEFAMAATLRLAANTARFGQPEVKLGVMPGFGGTQRLARLVGKGRALDLCLTGRMIKADEAFQWGLVNEIVEPERLISRGHEILRNLIKMGPFAMKSIMTVIDRGFDLTLEDAFEFEAAHFGLCCATQDKKEGINAFLEKRAAVFSGE